jgi:hypothetical protein
MLLSLFSYAAKDAAPKEKRLKFYYSETQEIRTQAYFASLRKPYKPWCVNETLYTEIADSSRYTDAVLIAELPRSHALIAPCPCEGKDITKFL